MTRTTFDFEALAVFQRGLDLVEQTDRLVRYFEGHRRRLGFHIVDAAGSVVFNVAESRGRRTIADRAHFLDMANGSAHEAGSGICIADRLDIAPPELRRVARRTTVEIISMLSTLTRRMRHPRSRP